MAALYDFFPTPQPKGSNKVRYHSQLVVKERITSEMMIELIADLCTLSPGDLAAVFVEFSGALCGLRKSTALHRLQTRVQEGRLTHPGYSRAPFYYPVPGHFRVSRHKEQGSSMQITDRQTSIFKK